MNYEKVIINTLDSFGVSRSYTGYNYVVYGLLLILEDSERIECITKTLYLDVAKHFHTNWNCVEKNMRTVVNHVWDSHNTELLETIFSRSGRSRKPTNKEFLKYMYDYIIQFDNESHDRRQTDPYDLPGFKRLLRGAEHILHKTVADI